MRTLEVDQLGCFSSTSQSNKSYSVGNFQFDGPQQYDIHHWHGNTLTKGVRQQVMRPPIGNVRANTSREIASSGPQAA